MTNRFKALGLALCAVLAMGALSASTASAELHSEASHTIISGAQPENTNDMFTVKAGTVTCQNTTYSGTTSSATTEAVSVVPSYSGCTAFGFVNATVDVGCHYTFTFGYWWRIIHLVITEPVQCLTVTAFNCHVKFGAQAMEGITYDNAGSGTSRDVTATANLSGLTYTQESKSFPGCTNGTFSDGTYKGSATLKGADTNGNAVGIWKT